MLRLYALSAALIFGVVILFGVLSSVIGRQSRCSERPVSSLIL